MAINIIMYQNQDLILLELPQRYMPLIPSGLGYVVNIIKPTGVRFQVIDFNILFHHLKNLGFEAWDVISANTYWKSAFIKDFQAEIDAIADGLISARPKIIGLSLSESNRAFAREVVKRVRASYPDVIILVGGYDCVYPYVAPHLFPDYDYICVGEAELTLVPLVKALASGKRPKDLPGIISRYDSPNRLWSETPVVDDLDSIDFPRYEWTDLRLYQDHYGGHSIPIMASRGCYWGRCRFCGECFLWRQRSAQHIADEMEWYFNQGWAVFLFGDSCINNNPETLLTTCGEINRRGLNVQFSGQFRVSKCGTKEYFAHLYRAGCRSLSFGIDGWTNHVLQLQRKGYTIEMAEENLRNATEAGIFTSVNIVIGVPGETEADIQETIRNAIRLKPYIGQFQNFNSLMLNAGSEYYLNPEAYSICFRQNKQELYSRNPYIIPTECWYSIDPYIDQKVRAQRLVTIFSQLVSAGVRTNDYARWQVEQAKGVLRK